MGTTGLEKLIIDFDNECDYDLYQARFIEILKYLFNLRKKGSPPQSMRKEDFIFPQGMIGDSGLVLETYFKELDEKRKLRTNIWDASNYYNILSTRFDRDRQ